MKMVDCHKFSISFLDWEIYNNYRLLALALKYIFDGSKLNLVLAFWVKGLRKTENSSSYSIRDVIEQCSE